MRGCLCDEKGRISFSFARIHEQGKSSLECTQIHSFVDVANGKIVDGLSVGCTNLVATFTEFHEPELTHRLLVPTEYMERALDDAGRARS